MGRFSTTVHIRSTVGSERFTKAFREVMRRKGYVPCPENDAVLTYLLASGGDWVTLASEKYADDPRGAYEEAVQTAAELNAGGFSIEIVDSDFAVLTTFGCGADTVIIGDGSGYGIEDAPKGNRECWQPLLAGSAAWEQLSETWDKNEVFVEDTLYKAAPLLGIEPKYMVADHRDLSESAESDGNIEELYFAKAKNGKTVKLISFNAAFVKIFGEALAPVGFKKIKGRQPYFARVVPGGEIVHVISAMPEQGLMRNEKSFTICGGAATVYRGTIDFSLSPRANSNWLIRNTNVYCNRHPYDDCPEMFEKLNRYDYPADDNDLMTNMLTGALGDTKQYLLPELDKVTELSEFVDFYRRYNLPLHIYDYEEYRDWGAAQDMGESEGLVLLKLFNTDDYKVMQKEELERYKAQMICLMENGRTGYTQSDLEDDCRRCEQMFGKNAAVFDKLLNDPQHHAETEMERRKKENLRTLRGCGLEI